MAGTPAPCGDMHANLEKARECVAFSLDAQTQRIDNIICMCLNTAQVVSSHTPGVSARLDHVTVNPYSLTNKLSSSKRCACKHMVMACLLSQGCKQEQTARKLVTCKAAVSQMQFSVPSFLFRHLLGVSQTCTAARFIPQKPYHNIKQAIQTCACSQFPL